MGICKKTGYLDQQSAVDVAMRQVCSKYEPYLRVYFCDDCQRWHITKMRKETFGQAAKTESLEATLNEDPA